LTLDKRINSDILSLSTGQAARSEPKRENAMTTSRPITAQTREEYFDRWIALKIEAATEEIARFATNFGADAYQATLKALAVIAEYLRQDRFAESLTAKAEA
jgi:hypothetical protein